MPSLYAFILCTYNTYDAITITVSTHKNMKCVTVLKLNAIFDLRISAFLPFIKKNCFSEFLVVVT